MQVNNELATREEYQIHISDYCALAVLKFTEQIHDSPSATLQQKFAHPRAKSNAVTSLLLTTAAYFLPLRPLVFGFIVAQRPPHAFGSVRLCRTFLLHLPWHAGGSVRGTPDGGGFFLRCCGPRAQRPPHALGSVRLTAAFGSQKVNTAVCWSAAHPT